MKEISDVFIKTIAFFFFLYVVVGCSANNNTFVTTEKLEVTIHSDKKKLEVNEPFKVMAEVKFGDKEISKDTEIQIEIIENGVPVGSATPEYEGGGKYSLEMMFSSEGHHQLVAHVYYQEFHEMPKLSFDLGSEGERHVTNTQ